MDEKTEIKSNIYAALAAAQVIMGKALKDTSNPHFKTKYADLSSVMAACLPALNANGIAVIQPTIDVDGKFFVETILVHVSGDCVKCRVPLLIGKNDMQGYGSAVTYARRYGLMSMAGIAPEDDDGNDAAKLDPRDEPVRETGPTAMQQAIAALSRAETLEALVSVWGAIPRSVQADAGVIQAKDARKAELTPKPADLGGDEIQY